MGSSDPPIVVTGGSVSIDFDQSQLQGSNGRFNNQNKKIKRVEVTGDGINFAENTPNGQVTIKIYYGNP
ncbi:MAG TPA: hypothetical protein VGX48_14575 [Pyrinomonadaceae bacterium]|jgi:hypothetical protein|nr:hypothetical protein [Pyrinomonadaceae bacterium]